MVARLLDLDERDARPEVVRDAAVGDVDLTGGDRRAMEAVANGIGVSASDRVDEGVAIDVLAEPDARVGRLGPIARCVEEIQASVLPKRDPRCSAAQARLGCACSGTWPAGDSSFTSTPVIGPQRSAKAAPTISSGSASMTETSERSPRPSNVTRLRPWARPSGSAFPASVHEPTQSSDHQSSAPGSRPRNARVIEPPS